MGILSHFQIFSKRFLNSLILTCLSRKSRVLNYYPLMNVFHEPLLELTNFNFVDLLSPGRPGERDPTKSNHSVRFKPGG